MEITQLEGQTERQMKNTYRQMDQWNRIESSEIHTHLHQLIFNKGVKNIP